MNGEVMKVYVIASSRERTRYREFVSLLEAIGVSVTYDWCADYDAVDKNGQTAHQMEEAGLRCMTGIHEAEAVIFLVPETSSRGAWAELGYASALDHVPLYAIGDRKGMDVWAGMLTYSATTDVRNVVRRMLSEHAQKMTAVLVDLVAEKLVESAEGVSLQECEANDEAKETTGTPSSAPTAEPIAEGPIPRKVASAECAAESTSDRDRVALWRQLAILSEPPCGLALSSLEPSDRCGVCKHVASAHRGYLLARYDKTFAFWGLIAGELGAHKIKTNAMGCLPASEVTLFADATLAARERIYSHVRPFVPREVAVHVQAQDRPTDEQIYSHVPRESAAHAQTQDGPTED